MSKRLRLEPRLSKQKEVHRAVEAIVGTRFPKVLTNLILDYLTADWVLFKYFSCQGSLFVCDCISYAKRKGPTFIDNRDLVENRGSGRFILVSMSAEKGQEDGSLVPSAHHIDKQAFESLDTLVHEARFLFSQGMKMRTFVVDQGVEKEFNPRECLSQNNHYLLPSNMVLLEPIDPIPVGK